MIKYYKLRVDTDDLDKMEEILKKYSTNYIVSLENEGKDNVHSHSYFETTTKGPTIRNVLRKIYGSGNSVYSLKELDEAEPIEYLAYVIKEKKYRYNVSEELIEKAKEYDSKVKEQIKEKKLKRRTVLQCLEDYIKEHHSSIFTNPYGPSQKDMVKIVVEYYKSQGILIRRFMLTSLVDTLSLKYVPNYSERLELEILGSLNHSVIG